MLLSRSIARSRSITAHLLPRSNMSTWSRLVRFVPANGSTASIGEPVDASLDIGQAMFEGRKDVQVNLFSGKSILNVGEPTGEKVTIGELLAPLDQKEVGTIRCIGLNYLRHAQEANLPIPTVPVVFLKPSTSLTSSHPSQIIIPKSVASDDAADFESELGIILSKDCKDVSEAEALDYVLGYTATNDVSSRKVQFEQSQWCFSKGFDSSCPAGPVVVSASAIPDPSKLKIKGIKIKSDGSRRTLQESPLSDLIFPIPKLISFLSRGTTLPAGTLILTGTPSGIGWYYDPKEVLQEGESFIVQVDGGIGSLINQIVVQK